MCISHITLLWHHSCRLLYPYRLSHLRQSGTLSLGNKWRIWLIFTQSRVKLWYIIGETWWRFDVLHIPLLHLFNCIHVHSSTQVGHLGIFISRRECTTSLGRWQLNSLELANTCIIGMVNTIWGWTFICSLCALLNAWNLCFLICFHCTRRFSHEQRNIVICRSL